MKIKTNKPLVTAIGAAFLASGAVPVMAGSSPFTVNPLARGYDLVSMAEADVQKTSTDSYDCCDHKQGEGKCGEGMCGEGKEHHHDKDMKYKHSEGKCGEGMCGEGKNHHQASDDSKHMNAEGKCGEGMCGTKKQQAKDAK